MPKKKLILQCQQDIPKGRLIPPQKFEFELECYIDYKRAGIIFEREIEGESFVYDMDYFGEGNKNTEEFPEAVSEWDFIGQFYSANDRNKNKGNCRAKIKNVLACDTD